MKAINFTIATLMLLLGLAACNDVLLPEETDYSYDESTGTYTVYNADGLLAWNEAVQSDLSLGCTLGADIDLTDIEYEWLLVGNETNPYTGIFEGSGYTITGLTINQSSSGYVGLIGYLSSDGKVQNLTLENVSITGNYSVGGVVGRNNGTVTDCGVSGTVYGSSSGIGGVVGRNYGTVTACSVSGSVTGRIYNIGGVVGSNYGIVTDCSVSGSVTGYSESVGGVVGYNSGTVTVCTASCSVSGVTGSSSYVGGVVGWNDGGIMTACTASGNVSSVDEYVGGVVGYNSGTVTNCSVSGSVYGSSKYVGGVVGWNDGGTVTACIASGSVSSSYSSDVGGVVGRNNEFGIVTACYSTGSVSGSVNGSHYAGGVVGRNDGTVTACYHASGSISGNNIGGVVGRNYGTVTACYWSDYDGNGVGPNNSGTTETTKVDGTDVTWAGAVEGMNVAIDTWNNENSDNQCEWQYVLTGSLPTLTKNE